MAKIQYQKDENGKIEKDKDNNKKVQSRSVLGLPENFYVGKKQDFILALRNGLRKKFTIESLKLKQQREKLLMGKA